VTSWRSSSSGVLSHFFSWITSKLPPLRGFGRIEDVGEKFDAFAQTFDDAEALVIQRALDHFHHVFDLGGVGARDEGGPGADQLFHRVDRLSIAPVGSVLLLNPMGEVGEVCFFVRP
jgi:hypothetical protein